MVIDDVSQYKTKMMIKFTTDEDLLELIDEPEIVKLDPTDLIYQNIFPYKRIPGTSEEAKVFILVGVDVPQVSTVNYFFKDMLLNIIVVCNSKKMKTPYGGTRVDMLAAIIKNLLNGSLDFSGRRLELVSDVEGVYEGGDWFFRNMRFNTTEIISKRCD